MYKNKIYLTITLPQECNSFENQLNKFELGQGKAFHWLEHDILRKGSVQAQIPFVFCDVRKVVSSKVELTYVENDRKS